MKKVLNLTSVLGSFAAASLAFLGYVLHQAAFIPQSEIIQNAALPVESPWLVLFVIYTVAVALVLVLKALSQEKTKTDYVPKREALVLHAPEEFDTCVGANCF